MITLTLRFYEELNDFLPPEKRKGDYRVEIFGRPSVKDIIESQGVPHPEVDLILVDGESVSFTFRPVGGERIAVYPVFESFDIRGVIRLRPEPLRVPRFILDIHLGKLARFLRILGFDSVYEPPWEDAVLADRAGKEGRILLTRDRGMLKRSVISRGYCPRSDKAREQLKEVVDRFDLKGSVKPFTRCPRCNGPLRPLEGEERRQKLPPGRLMPGEPPSASTAASPTGGEVTTLI